MALTTWTTLGTTTVAYADLGRVYLVDTSTGRWMYVGDSVTTTVNVPDDRPADRGEEDRVIEIPTAPEGTTHRPVRLTRGMLRSMDSCGEYLRKFATLFPEQRFPGGVEINQQNCVANYRRFDWQWARDRMLTDDGRRVLDDLAASRLATVHEQFGTGNAKRAAIFGYLIDRCPQFRSERLIEAERYASSEHDRNLVRAVERARKTISDARQAIEYHTKIIAEHEAKLPELEAAAGPALVRVAQQVLEDAERNERDAQRRLAVQRDLVATRRGEVARLTAQLPPAPELESVPEPEPEPEPEPVTAPEVRPEPVPALRLSVTVPDNASSLRVVSPAMLAHAVNDDLF